MWDKRAEHLKTVDGQTVKMVLDQGHGDTKLVSVRLLGIYGQESDQPGGPACKEFINRWFGDHGADSTGSDRWGFIVTTSQLPTGEIVASITDITISHNLNAELAEFIHANGFK